MSDEVQQTPDSELLPSDPAVVADGPDEYEDGSSLPCPVTAIGASAGGVEAYVALFSALPADTGMAFVVV